MFAKISPLVPEASALFTSRRNNPLPENTQVIGGENTHLVVQQLTGEALNKTMLDAEGSTTTQVALSYLREESYRAQPRSISGVRVEDRESQSSATLLIWDFRGPTENKTARLVYVLDETENHVQVGFGLIQVQPNQDRVVQLFEVEGEELVHKSNVIINKEGSLVGNQSQLINGSILANDCLTCQQVCGARV